MKQIIFKTIFSVCFGLATAFLLSLAIQLPLYIIYSFKQVINLFIIPTYILASIIAYQFYNS